MPDTDIFFLYRNSSHHYDSNISYRYSLSMFHYSYCLLHHLEPLEMVYTCILLYRRPNKTSCH